MGRGGGGRRRTAQSNHVDGMDMRTSPLVSIKDHTVDDGWPFEKGNGKEGKKRRRRVKGEINKALRETVMGSVITRSWKTMRRGEDN